MTGVSRASVPASTSRITSVVVKTLVMEPIWKRVSGATGCLVSRLQTPKPAVSRWPSRSTPTATPGTSQRTISARICSANFVGISICSAIASLLQCHIQGARDGVHVFVAATGEIDYHDVVGTQLATLAHRQHLGDGMRGLQRGNDAL